MNTLQLIPADVAAPVNAQTAAYVDRQIRRAVIAKLSALQYGHLTIVDPLGNSEFGVPSGRAGGATLRATVSVKDLRFYRKLVLGGSVGAGEAYMAGCWTCDDLPSLIRVMVRNREIIDRVESGVALPAAALRLFRHFLRRDTLSGSRRNIAAHYDLGNDFFALFLSEDLMYSCAAFEHDTMTLEEASRAKLDRICRKLELSPDDHLLEIGTGWGGLAIHAAANYGCRVTTTTISREQYDFARRRVAECSLTDRVAVLLKDYRELIGRFDKLASIEMVEAVGHQFLDTYFGICSRLLKPEGMMLLQAITIADEHYAAALRSVDFIKRYIFPGSFIPSLTALCNSTTSATDLRLSHLEDFTPFYARTLREWRKRFLANLGEVRALGFSDEFIRMWEFYLCYCEGGFSERYIGNVQLLLTKPLCRRRPIVAEFK